MAHIQGVDRRQPMLLPEAVEDYVGEDNPVRAIDAFVDNLDLPGMGFTVKPDAAVGQPGYHPASLLKLYLWGYFTRVRSSRRLERACLTDLEAIWLTGKLTPDHSTISDFRKAHAAALKGVFKEFNLICLALNLFSRELIAIDGTFVKAVNGKARSFTKTKLAKLIEQLEGTISRWLGQLDAVDREQDAPSGGADTAAALGEKIEKMRARQGGYRTLLAECDKSPTGQVNLTDPDCRQLQKAKGKIKEIGYNVQAAVEGDNHLVTSFEVTQDANDLGQLDPMAQQAKADIGLEPDAPLGVLADKGYYNSAQIGACEEHGTKAYVPETKQPRTGEDGIYPPEKFTYQADTDSYRCPAGNTLPRKSDKRYESGGGSKIYYDSATCKGCPLLGACTKGKYRKLNINKAQDALDAVKARLKAAPELYRRRRDLVEHPFGTIKMWNGREDLLCKGLTMAGAEMGLSFWAYNFKRVLKIVGMERLLEALSGMGKRV
jgi:transposase